MLSIVIILASLLQLSSAQLQTDFSYVPAPENQQIFVKTLNPHADWAVIFIHGILHSHSIWQPQYKIWDEDVTTVLLDLYGHGFSRGNVAASSLNATLWASSIHAVIDSTHSEKVILVGWSLGGVVAQVYVNQFNDPRVKGIVLVDTVNDIIPSLVNFDALIVADAIFANPTNKTNFLEFSLSVIAPHSPPQVSFNGFEVSLGSGTALSEGQITSVGAIFSSLFSLTYGRFTRSSFEVLIIHGAQDELLSVNAAAYMKLHNYPDASIYILQDASHLSFYDQFDRFNSILSNFIRHLVHH